MTVHRALEGVPAEGAEPRVPGWTVVFTRGSGCREVAEALSAGEPHRLSGDLRSTCIATGADLLVTGRIDPSDLIGQVVPHQAQLDRVGSVVAAVGTGPHSMLAARVAARLARVLRRPGTLISASAAPGSDEDAERILDEAHRHAPHLDRRVVRAGSARAIARSLDEDSFLILGAPGGPWWQRQFFGHGHRLMVAAPCGALVVRTAPARAYQRLESSEVLAAELRVVDALRFSEGAVVPVAADGYLIGVVRRRALQRAGHGDTVRSVMEAPVSVAVDDPIDDLDQLRDALEGAPVPVVDDEGRLLGAV